MRWLPTESLRLTLKSSQSSSSRSQIHQHDRQIRRGDAADAAGSTQVGRADAAQFFFRFRAQLRHSRVVEVSRDRSRFLSLEPFHLGRLPVDVSRIFGFQDYLLDGRWRCVEGSEGWIQLAQVAPIDVRPAEDFFQCLLAVTMASQVL